MATKLHVQKVLDPYNAARREWNERYGDYIAAARQWRIVAVSALALAGIMAVGMIYTATRSQFIPYVVEVDHFGAVSSRGSLQKTTATDPRIIKAALVDWIINIRSVSTDFASQKQLINRGYAYVNAHGPALQLLKQYHKDHDPFRRASYETVSITRTFALPISDRSWRIEWDEQVINRDGRASDIVNWEANVTLKFSPPVNDEQQMMLNPLGIYIDVFSWSPRL